MLLLELLIRTGHCCAYLLLRYVKNCMISHAPKRAKSSSIQYDICCEKNILFLQINITHTNLVPRGGGLPPYIRYSIYRNNSI